MLLKKSIYKQSKYEPIEYQPIQYQTVEYQPIKYTDIDALLEECALSKDGSWDSFKRDICNFSIFDAKASIYDAIYTIPDIADGALANVRYNKPCCDKWDYALAAASGIATGLIDAFFVKMPGQSPLGKVADDAVDSAVVKFANMVYHADGVISKGKSTRRKAPNNIASAIGFLEDRFRVNYDARFPKELVGGEVLTHFNPSSHHLKSLAHCPDLVGLFFSILDQFTNQTTIINNGKVVRLEFIDGRTQVYGGNFISKIICGCINWFGHLMSDVTGSSGTRGHDGRRGMGIPIPGFELLQFSGKNCENEMKGLAALTEKMFLHGYDFRFGIAMSVPVIINDMLVKLCWAIRERFCFGKPWSSIRVETKNDRRLTRMLLVSSGCFSLVDIVDAGIRSEGNLLIFALHLNYVGLCKLALAGFREVALHIGEFGEDDIEEILEREWAISKGVSW